MMKHLILSACLLGFLTAASAQPVFEPEFQPGWMTGLTKMPETTTIKTELITMKGQRKAMDNRSPLQLGDINQQIIKTRAVIFSGKRTR